MKSFMKMKNKGSTFWLKSKVGRTFVCNGRHLEPGGYHWRLTIPNRNFRYDLLIRKRLWEGWCGSSSCWGGRVSGGACLVHAHYVLEILLQISKRTPKKIETCFLVQCDQIGAPLSNMWRSELLRSAHKNLHKNFGFLELRS